MDATDPTIERLRFQPILDARKRGASARSRLERTIFSFYERRRLHLEVAHDRRECRIAQKRRLLSRLRATEEFLVTRRSSGNGLQRVALRAREPVASPRKLLT
jgi:hypothetical protein